MKIKTATVVLSTSFFLLVLVSFVLDAKLSNKLETISVENQLSNQVSPVLIVVIAIGIPYDGLGADSHKAYAQRHGYRLVVQRKWRGTMKRPSYRGATHSQKLLACSHARGEQYVLIIDGDVVIAPWTPPIHLTLAPSLGSNIGIVDEDQPTPQIRRLVEEHFLGKATNVDEYYNLFGDNIAPNHGMLNSGVLFVPNSQCEWLRDVYYSDNAQKWFQERHEHIDQPVLGAAMLRDRNYRIIPHAWNRGWIYYKTSSEVGGPAYDLGEVFHKSYFMHFYWKKSEIKILKAWMRHNNVTFDPRPYATEQLP